MNTLRVLGIRFNLALKQKEVPLFRGAVNSILPKGSVLFHQHRDDSVGGFRYGYPLVQYKICRRKATIICVGAGIDAFTQFISSFDGRLSIGSQENTSVAIEEVGFEEVPISELFQPDSLGCLYKLRNWLPLNRENYQTYLNCSSMIEQIELLEGILVGNILSLLKGVGIYFDEAIVVRITQMDEPRIQQYKGVRLMSFSLCFRSNVKLPNDVGLGRHVSVGYGTVMRNNNHR